MEPTSATVSGRARPMATEERRTMIATAALPLFIEEGASVTTRQIADQLGIAEGTIFRAFGDKDALVRAVVDTFFEQTYDTLAPGLIAPELSLEEKLHAVIVQARSRSKGTFAMLSLLDPGEAREYMKHRKHGSFEQIAAAAFSTDAAKLNVPQEKLSAILRLLVIAASAPQLSNGERLEDADLVAFALYGVAGHPEQDGLADDSRKA